MRLAETRAALRRNLSGLRTDWTNEVLDGGVTRAVDDLDRILPQEVITDLTLQFTIIAEVWASGTLGSEVTLANKRIKPESETVKDEAGAIPYERDTDYTMDYVAGTITTIATGDIVDSSNNQIDYTILEVYVDLSNLTDLIRIFRVEYPGGQVPAEFQTFYTWGDFLVITARGRESQQRLASGKHVWVYYHKKHTTPDKDTDGTWKPQLDEVVLKGAQSYCLATKALELRHSVKIRQASSVTALGELAAITTKMDTALTRTAEQASSAVADLSNIDGYISDMLSALASVSTFLASATSSVADAEAQAVVAAGDIADADSPLATALTKLAAVDTLITKTTGVINDGISYSRDAGTPLNNAKDNLDAIVPLIEDSDKKIADVDSSRAQARSWFVSGGTALGFADIYLQTHTQQVMATIDSLKDNPINLVGTSIEAAGNQLISGLALINQVNIGDSVTEMYRRYADTWLTAARMRYDEWLTFLGKADRFISMSGGLIAEASEWRGHAEGYLSEANIVLGEINALLSKVAAYQANAGKQIDVAQTRINRGRAVTESASVYVGNTGRALEQAAGYHTTARLQLEAADASIRLVETHIATAVQFVNMAQAKIAEGAAMQAPITAVIEAAGQKLEVARIYQGDSDRRIQELGLKLQESDRYIVLGNQELELADRLDDLSERVKRDFMEILMDRAQVRSDSAITPTRQEAP